MDSRTQIIRDLMGKTVHVEVDRPAGCCHNGLIYPVNYGFIPGITAGDGEEQDAYILGVSGPLTCFDGKVIGAIRRRNDCEDKLVVAPEGLCLHQGQIAEAVHFQERFFDTTIDCLFRKSCGVMPYRFRNGEMEILIVYERFAQCWSLPKGHMEAGETEIQTALRELYEETGLTAEPDDSLSASIEYPVGPVSRKQVVFFPARVSGVPRIQESEIDNFRWIRLPELADYLFFDTVRAVAGLAAGLKQPE